MGHCKHANGQLTHSYFSQWWTAAFVVDGITYPTAEHYMVAQKVKLFGDEDSFAKNYRQLALQTNQRFGQKSVRFCLDGSAG